MHSTILPLYTLHSADIISWQNIIGKFITEIKGKKKKQKIKSYVCSKQYHARLSKNCVDVKVYPPKHSFISDSPKHRLHLWKHSIDVPKTSFQNEAYRKFTTVASGIQEFMLSLTT